MKESRPFLYNCLVSLCIQSLLYVLTLPLQIVGWAFTESFGDPLADGIIAFILSAVTLVVAGFAAHRFAVATKSKGRTFLSLAVVPATIVLLWGAAVLALLAWNSAQGNSEWMHNGLLFSTLSVTVFINPLSAFFFMDVGTLSLENVAAPYLIGFPLSQFLLALAMGIGGALAGKRCG